MKPNYTFNAQNRYMTSGIRDKVPLSIQILIWRAIDDLVQSETTTDYLQVFTCKAKKGALIITHAQEEPVYTKTYHYNLGNDLSDDFKALDNKKIYVIDDITHSTMLLASEY